jgi:hypothetical protein
MGEDRFYNGHPFAQNLMVPKAHNLKSLLLQESCALSIRLRLYCMLTALHFNNQLFFEANEIDDKWPYGMLTAKLPSGEIPIAQLIP